MYFCTSLLTGLILFIAWYFLIHDPYFFSIDSCLDLGGRWNYEINECEGSPRYIEWQNERQKKL